MTIRTAFLTARIVENDDANITIKQMAENLSLSTRAIEKQIAKLREKNLLSRDGADNGGSWVILSNNKKDV